MTNKEAYEILEKYIRCSNNECPPVDCDECHHHVAAKQLDDALQVALDALKEPEKPDSGSKTCINPEIMHDRTTDDCISRRTVLDALHEYMDDADYTLGYLHDVICNLPSVQPDHIAEANKKDDENGDDLIRREDALMSLTGEWTESRDEILSKAIRRIKRLPSVQPEHDDADFWRKRSDEYEKMFLDLYWRMVNGVKFESMHFDENGITLNMKEPSQEDNT